MRRKSIICISVLILLVVVCTIFGISEYQKKTFLKTANLIDTQTETSAAIESNLQSLSDITGVRFDARIPLHRALAEKYDRIRITNEAGTILKDSAVPAENRIAIYTKQQESADVRADFVCIENGEERSGDYQLLCQITDKTGHGFANKGTYRVSADGLLWNMEDTESQFALYYYQEADVFLQKSAELGGVFTAENPPAKYKLSDANTREGAQCIQLCGKLIGTDQPLSSPKLVTVELKTESAYNPKKTASYTAAWWIGQ